MRTTIPNTLGVTAHARRLLEVSERQQLLDLRQGSAEPTLMLGDGSNVLFAADPTETVLLNRLRGIELLDEDAAGCRLQVAAGEPWDALVSWCGERGWWGIENLALIPGRVGAAPIQNIGAYGVEFADVCEAVEVIDEGGRLRWLSSAECQFGYRDSLFKQSRPELWIVAVRLRLWRQARPRLDYAGLAETVDALNIARPGPLDIADVVRAIRRSKLPDPARLGNAGSFFKNPQVSAEVCSRLRELLPGLPGWPQPDGQVKLSAAYLIEQAGWKGVRRGDAGIAPGHALVLVNHGRASGSELLELARAVQADVARRYGVALEAEPRIITGARQVPGEAL